MKNILRNSDGELNGQVVVALIGASATLATALIAGIFGLIQLRASNAPPPAPITQPAATTQPAPTAVVAPQLEVEIEGPDEAPLNQQTYFTIISSRAIRAEWAITNFGRGDVDPFGQVSQIYVEPKDSSRVGESFTMVVTVYDEDGNEAGARHSFTLVEE